MEDIPFDRTPIIRMLSECLGSEQVSYHMPGHNRGMDFPGWLHQHALMIDTTEFALTDDLNNPQRRIADALELARQAFGAGRTFFVTTGATIAIHSVLYALTRPGDLIIAGRNAHRSLAGACRMFGLRVVFTGDEGMAEALFAYPDAVLVFITRPDYYGACSDIGEISETVHHYGKILVVDEAHGTHFAFAPRIMPPSALSGGGDVVIQSAHKTTPALTQGAYLHISNEAMATGRVTGSQISGALSTVTTSSPSFLIAATLDYARAYLEIFGQEKSTELFGSIRHFYSLLDPEWLACIPGAVAGESSCSSASGRITSDPFRMVVSPYNIGISPSGLSEALGVQGIYPEFVDLTRVVLIAKFSNTLEDFSRLADVLNGLSGSMAASGRAFTDRTITSVADVWALQCRLDGITCSPSMRLVDFRRSGLPDHSTELVPLASAAGRIPSEDCIPYPPGIPLIFAGEAMDFGSIELLLACLREGLTVNGIESLSENPDQEAVPFIRCFR